MQKMSYNENQMEDVMKKIKIVAISVGIICAIAIGLIFFYFDGQRAVSSTSKEVEVEISGSTNTVLNQLDKAGLLKNKTVAMIYTKLNNYDFKANTYILNQNMDLKTILSILEGDKEYISSNKITILEGYTIPESAKQVAKVANIEIDKENLSDDELLELKTQKVLETWANKEYLQTLIDKYWFLDQIILSDEIMFALEGYLAPDTYVITKKTSIEDITTMMLDQMGKNLDVFRDELAQFKVNNVNLTVHQFLSLASIVQCEASKPSQDQAKIAGVFINRLEKPMRLQSDVTVNYANQIKTVAVTYKHLEVDSKYNTYKYDGLPIGPISSVSKEVIDSCLHYQKSEALFFFALKDGTIIYSNSYGEHQQVVKENKWY